MLFLNGLSIDAIDAIDLHINLLTSHCVLPNIISFINHSLLLPDPLPNTPSNLKSRVTKSPVCPDVIAHLDCNVADSSSL